MPIKICTETGFGGDKKRFQGAIDNLVKRQFYGPIKSLIVEGHRPWVLCADFDYKGKAIVCEPGEYADISRLAPFTVKSLCELVDTDSRKEGRLEICVEDAEMIIDKSCGEFVFQKRPQKNPQSPMGQDYKVKARLEVTGGTWVLYSEQNYGGDCAIVTTISNGRRMSFGQLATVRSARKLCFAD